MTLNFQSYLPDFDLSHISVHREELFQHFQETIAKDDIGFFEITQRKNYITSTLKVYEQIKHKKHFVQIGIGGSALGPQMLISSLSTCKDKTFSLIDNTDSQHLFDTLERIHLKDTLFYVVSKSGGTAETIAGYSVARQLLKKQGISETQFSDYFVFCTDEYSGQLREHVAQNHYTSLVVPSDVGGRFSVLTPVGLLPAAFMGLDIQKLFDGAESYKQQLQETQLSNNPLITIAEQVIKLSDQCPMTVFMPYSSKLKDLSSWFVQLWAESLGKYSAKQDKNIGLTPIPAYGATDQHSQVQLFMEGPNDKLIFLLNIKDKSCDYSLDSDLPLESAQKLSKYTMNELLNAEFDGTLKALQENNRNVIAIEIPQLNEESLAKVILFFEALTVVVGLGLKVDPFNQPGVEKGKKYAFEYLNSLRK